MRRAASRGRAARRRRGSMFAEVTATFARTDSTGIATSRRSNRDCGARGIDAPIVFTPHVVPIARGMLADAYARVRRARSTRCGANAVSRSVRDNAFVRIFDGDARTELPAVAGTNDAEMRVSTCAAASCACRLRNR